MKPQTYTKKDLVDFGNYLLSEKREQNLVHETNKRSVTDADLANWSEVNQYSKSKK